MKKSIAIQSLSHSCQIMLPGGEEALLCREDIASGNAQLTVWLSYDGAYGMGEKFNSLNQKGLAAHNHVEEKFCFQGEKTYCPAPFFMTDTGFGLYIHTGRRTSFSFQEDHIRILLPEDAPITLFTGTPREIIAEYMSLFGPAKLPPKWAFGPWISANRWNTQKQVEEQMELLRRHQFPATVIVIEAWSDEATFYIFNGAKYTPVPDGAPLAYEDFDFAESPFWPDPKAMVDQLHAQGIRLVLWQIPVYKKQNPDEETNQQNELDRAHAASKGLCVHTQSHEAYAIPKGHWFAGSMVPDFTNEQTVKTWFSKRQYLLDMGVDGFKTDGGEFILRPDLLFADGTDGQDQESCYAQNYIERYTNFLDKGHVLFSRAGFSGQHTTPIHWAGDQQSTNGELCCALNAGLSAAMTGIPFWGFDIAGFAGPLPTLDLYRRATQLACFCPVMQWHSEPDGGQFRELMPGGKGINDRSPWNMADAYQQPQFIEEMRFWHNLRMNLLPYLYSTALECVAENMPMIRPMAYLWPKESRLKQAWHQFMLGDSLLVVPLLEENATSTKAVLPWGGWYALFSQKRMEGGATIWTSPEDKFPVYIKEGTALFLNLPQSRQIGDSVGNSVNGYQIFTAIVTGKEGSGHFADEAGNDFVLSWSDDRWSVTGSCTQIMEVAWWK